MIRTGIPLTSHKMLDGVIRPLRHYGQFKYRHERQTTIKLRLQNSRNRKAPITLATAPFDHKDDRP